MVTKQLPFPAPKIRTVPPALMLSGMEPHCSQSPGPHAVYWAVTCFPETWETLNHRNEAVHSHGTETFTGAIDTAWL